MRSPSMYRTASKRDAGHLAISFFALAINLLQLVYIRFTRSVFIEALCVCLYPRLHISLLHGGDRGGGKASFCVVVWSPGVTSVPWQLTPVNGSKIWLFWHDSSEKKKKSPTNVVQIPHSAPTRQVRYALIVRLLKEGTGWRICDLPNTNVRWKLWWKKWWPYRNRACKLWCFNDGNTGTEKSKCLLNDFLFKILLLKNPGKSSDGQSALTKNMPQFPLISQ